MEFFDMPINVVLAQILGGSFTGFCLGIATPSEYERSFSFEERKKVWKWKKNKPLNLISFITYLIKIVIAMSVVGFVNIAIARYFNAYPMSKHADNLYIFGIFFILIMFISEKLRYLYFKSKVN